MSAMLLLMMEHDSINLYWQQAYHHDFPAKLLIERHGFLQHGNNLTKWAIALKNSLLANMGQVNKNIITYINDNIFVPSRTSKKDNLHQIARIPDNIQPVSLEQDSRQENAATPVHSITLTREDKVLFVGDSLMQGVAPHIRKALHKQHGIVGIDLSKQSTGLAYPSFYNWPKQTAAAFKGNNNIRLMVVFLGPNDPWDIPSPSGKGYPYLKFKSDDWEKVYRSRIREMLAIAQGNSAKVIWLSPPNMKRRKLNDGMIYLDKLFSDEVKDIHGYFVPTSNLLGCYNNQFSSFVELDGKRIKVRIDDGVHFTLAGQKLIADKVLSLIHVK